MARPKTPSIPDAKLRYYEEQLARQLSHLFTWEGLPSTIPKDYLERNLIRHGSVLFYESDTIGHDVMRCEVTGFNRHEMPVNARTYSPSTVPGEQGVVTRRLRYLSDYDTVANDFDTSKDGVLIRNMEYGQNMWEIIEHFARRLFLAQQAFDTNLLYANMPYIFQTSDDKTRLSIEKYFSSIFNGEPFVIVDSSLGLDLQKEVGTATKIPFIAKDIYDVKNEIMMDFHKTIGIDTAGVEKAERVNLLEVESNNQYTQTVLQIMLEQRELAVERINTFFGLSVSVNVRGEEVQENGSDDSRTEAPLTDEL